MIIDVCNCRICNCRYLWYSHNHISFFYVIVLKVCKLVTMVIGHGKGIDVTLPSKIHTSWDTWTKFGCINDTYYTNNIQHKYNKAPNYNTRLLVHFGIFHMLYIYNFMLTTCAKQRLVTSSWEMFTDREFRQYSES